MLKTVVCMDNFSPTLSLSLLIALMVHSTAIGKSGFPTSNCEKEKKNHGAPIRSQLLIE